MNSLKNELGKDRLEAFDDDDDDDLDAAIPGTVFNKRQARMLKNAVIVMGLMLVAGFVLLIGIIAYRASQPATAPASVTIAPAGISVPDEAAIMPAPRQAKIIEASIPKGAKYLGSTMNGDRLVVTVQTPGKDLKLLLIDLRSWQVLGEAHLKQGE